MGLVNDLMENGVPEIPAKHAVYNCGKYGFATALEWFYLHIEDKEIYKKPPMETIEKDDSEELM